MGGATIRLCVQPRQEKLLQVFDVHFIQNVVIVLINNETVMDEQCFQIIVQICLLTNSTRMVGDGGGGVLRELKAVCEPRGVGTAARVALMFGGAGEADLTK